MMKSIVLGSLIILSVYCGNAQEAKLTCSGYVYDSLSLQPLASVNISIAGSTAGTTTNANGFFKIRLPSASAVLIFSYMGFGVRQVSINTHTPMPVRVYLLPELKTIGEVAIFNDRFRNILKGDSLLVLDYEIWDNRLLIMARSAKDSLKQRIYLTSLGGYVFSYRELHDMGKMIKFPDEPRPKMIYLFKDTYGEVQLLAKNRVWQIYLNHDRIYLLYPSKYEDCDQYLFPIKCRLNDKLFFQRSDEKYNSTYFQVRDTDTIKRIKQVYDDFGNIRYLRTRNVCVPMITYKNQVVLFNFFKNEMEFFNEQGRSVKRVPTMFHTMMYYDALGKKAYDLDVINFTQDIVVDAKTEKVYAIWRKPLTGRFMLKELDMDTGMVNREIPVPNHPFIDKVQVYDNQVWFMFRDRQEQRYKSLYTMYLD